MPVVRTGNSARSKRAEGFPRPTRWRPLLGIQSQDPSVEATIGRSDQRHERAGNLHFVPPFQSVDGIHHYPFDYPQDSYLPVALKRLDWHTLA